MLQKKSWIFLKKKEREKINFSNLKEIIFFPVFNQSNFFGFWFILDLMDDGQEEPLENQNELSISNSSYSSE